MFATMAGLQIAAVVSSTPAQAAAGPVQDRREVTADSLPTVQINGVVWRQLAVGNTVYAGGEFSKARPAGSAPGTNEVTRTNLLAYDLETGVLKTNFAPTFNAKVKSLAVSPDGTKLYVGGSFTQVNGQPRNRIAAFDIATGALLPFTASFNSTVNAIVVTNSTVYVGGLFNYANSTLRPSLAALNPTTGALQPWAAKTNGYVQAMVMTADASRLVIGGNFSTVNDIEAKGLSAVTTATGATLPFAINQVIQNTGDAQSILSLQLDAEGFVYGTAFAYGGPGPFFEGVFAADSMTGTTKWLADCHGDSYDAARLGSAVYAVSHHHHCENVGGFPDTNPRLFWQRGNAFSAEATGTVNNNNQGGYPNFGGQPAPSLLTWFPKVDSGTYTGQTQGGWTITTTAKYVLMGGEFPSINNVGQQGLARFAVAASAPKQQGPVITGTAIAPGAVAVSNDRVRVKIPANWDRDNYSLTYQLFREGTATPIYTTTAQSLWWKLPALGYDDIGLVSGRTYRYRVVTSDADGNSVTSPWTSVAVPATVHPYLSQVFADGASHYWRLGAAGAWADYAGGMDLTSTGSVSADNSGAIIGDSNPATAFSGSSFGSSTAREAGPDTFTVEAWFKTTSTSGGKIVGFGDQNTRTSGNYDRHVYMQNDGRLTFGVHPGQVRTVTSSLAYNDGAWHQAVAVLGSEGMKLYVDGQLVGQRADTTSGQPFAGNWRVGGDNLGGWPTQPSSNFLAGSIDEVSVYPTALTRNTIRDHYTKSGRTLAGPPVPTDALGQAVWADEPSLLWRLNESTGTAGDATGNGWDGAVTGGVTRPVTSPVTTGTGYTTNGSDGLISTQTAINGPSVYSTELWFKTTSTTGGKLIGFGNSPTGWSSSYDRHVYLENDGRVSFGVWTGQTNVITSPGTYNDNQWHHMVATQGPSGMVLYLDGVAVGTNPTTGAQPYSGYWRVGGDSPWTGSGYIAASIDEVAVYDKVLSLSRIRAHYRASTADTNAVPTADFTASCNAAGTCTFTSTSTDSDGDLEAGSWNFGDSTPAALGLTASHNYATSGTYQVTLTVTDDQGGQANVTKPVTVTVPVPNVPPTAGFSQTCTELACSFSSTSTDSDGTIATLAWDFGDGETGSGATPNHTFASSGSYQVKLTVTDDDGAATSITKTVTVVGNEAPTAAYSNDCTVLACSFNGGSSSDPDGTISSYAWDFGDGGNASTASPNHTFATAGTYQVKLTVTDNDGASDSVTKSITVSAANQDPSASFTATVSGRQVSVNASASDDPDGSIASYQWNFGDGATGTGATTQHSYTSDGSYTITLTVTDNDGGTDTATRNITVNSVLAQDNFQRTASNWGSAQVGGAWTYTTGAANFSTDGTRGVIRLATAGARGTASLAGVSARDVELTASVSPGTDTTGSGVQSTFFLRQNGNNDYRVTVQLHGDKSVRLNWTRVVGGTATSFGDVKISGLTYATGDVLLVKASAVGNGTTTLAVKVWKQGTAEPANSQFTRTDTTAALQSAGAFSISGYLTGSATTVPFLLRVDDLAIRAI